jgi:hypothetical protein
MFRENLQCLDSPTIKLNTVLIVGKTRYACGKPVDFRAWMWANARERPNVITYPLLVCYHNEWMSLAVWYMEGIIGVLLETSLLYCTKNERARFQHCSGLSLEIKRSDNKRLANDPEFFLRCRSYVLENEIEFYSPDLQPFPPRAHFC